jgi:hypothetical protein
MVAYKLYRLDGRDREAASPELVEARTDEEAIYAVRAVKCSRYELWDQTRLVSASLGKIPDHSPH